MSNERRTFSRIEFDATTLLCQDEQRWDVVLIDVSLNGALVTLPDEFDGDRNRDFTLYIHLGADIAINMIVTLAHLREDQAGFRCESIDLDSMTHLRRVVELNLGDSDLLERELAALG